MHESFLFPANKGDYFPKWAQPPPSGNKGVAFSVFCPPSLPRVPRQSHPQDPIKRFKENTVSVLIPQSALVQSVAFPFCDPTAEKTKTHDPCTKYSPRESAGIYRNVNEFPSISGLCTELEDWNDCCTWKFNGPCLYRIGSGRRSCI